jgi:hypothetical protein
MRLQYITLFIKIHHACSNGLYVIEYSTDKNLALSCIIGHFQYQHTLIAC